MIVKLEVSEQMLAVIGDALGNHAYKVAAPVIEEIQKQYDAQRGSQSSILNKSANSGTEKRN